MKKYMVAGIWALLILTGCGNKPATAPVPATDSAQTVTAKPEIDFAVFWTKFREAAVAGNFAELAKRTVFPLQTRGTMDEEPIVTYTENEFEAMFRLFLKTPTGLNSSNFDETQLDYIKATPALIFNDTKVPMMHNNKTASVTSMEFENTPEGWKLKLVYLTDEVYQKTGKHPAI